MGRVDSEGDSLGNRGQNRVEGRRRSSNRSHLRRLSLESLEHRELLSSLPEPTTLMQSMVGGSDSSLGNSSSPSVAVDPLNANKLVAAWTTYDPGNKLDGPNGQITTYVQGAYSIDGGVSWTSLPNSEAADIQDDFTVAPPSGAPQPNFSQTTDATVGFDRNQNAYLLSSTHDGTGAGTLNSTGAGGVLNLQRWAFTGSIPTSQVFPRAAFNQQFGSTFVNPIYRWQGADAAVSPTLAVDSNLASFTDGTTTQTDPYSGNVYVAWQTVDTAPKGVTSFNPNTIKIMASANLGQAFTYQSYLPGTGHGTGNSYDSPRIAISQGSAGVPGGQVTIVYENSGPGGSTTVKPNFDIINTQTSTTGGIDEHYDAFGQPINNAIKDGIASGVDASGITVVPFAVNITDANFATLQNLTLTLSMSFPNLGDTSAALIAPDGTTVSLWTNATNNAGQATMAFPVLGGANIGQSAEKTFIGTVLDSTAFRSIFDGNVSAPYLGHFRPLGNLQQFQGRTAVGLNGTWQFVLTDYRNETTPPLSINGASLDFTSGVSMTANGDVTRTVGRSYLNSGAVPYTDGVQGVPVLPDPTIASDNTLGSHSPHQGRLYIALTNDNYSLLPTPGTPTDSTFIDLYISDNGGRSWTFNGHVNDDNGDIDGFSTGTYSQPGSGTQSINLAFDGEANVRPKLNPQVAVDPYTGTVVVSFLDARNDASRVRVANYIAVSNDGGNTFAPQTYANESTPLTVDPFTGELIQQKYVNAITGQEVNLGPIPDNESAGNGGREATFGFGQTMGLAIANGRIIPVWSSNQNGTTAGNVGSNLRNNQKTFLNIESAVVTYAAGPRVIASTQGPVGQTGDLVNTTKAADGSPIANTIVLTFDRGVDPTTFLPDGPTNPIGTSPLQVFYNNPSGTAAPVPLRVLSVTHNTTNSPITNNTIYTITFDPAGHGVGTYTYTLRPLVKGQIPYTAVISATASENVPILVTNQNSGQFNFTVAGHPGQNLATATISGNLFVTTGGPVPVNSPNDLQILLVAPSGATTVLFRTSTFRNQFFPVDVTVAIPAGSTLDGNYTLRVVDNVAGEVAEYYGNSLTTNFDSTIQVSGPASMTTVTGNLLDQNADGVTGQAVADNYSIPNGRNSLPLIVPGPHVVSTTVVGVGGTTATGSANNLINNDNVKAISVTFDRTMQVSSFTPAQILNVTGPVGRIDGPQTFASTGTSKTYPFLSSAQLIPKASTGTTPTSLTSTITISSTGLSVSSLNVVVNITDPNDASLKLSLVAPDGITTVPLVAAGTASGANFTNTVFSDAPSANGLTGTIPTGRAPYSLSYQPASPLSALAGKFLDGVWRLVISDSTTTGPQGQLNSWALNVTPRVPQGVGTALNSTLNIPSYGDGSFKVNHLAVQLNISTNNDSDLKISLISPVQANGSRVTVPLILGSGIGGGNNFTNTIFDDNATLPITSGSPPYGLTYKPVGSLATLNGLSINGTWTLQIINPNADGSVTTLNSWSLIATPQLTVTPVNPVNGGATTFTIGFPTQVLSGNYNVTLSPNILSVAANPANPSSGTPLDTNLNAGVDALRGVSSGPTTTDLFTATAVPVPIPYATMPSTTTVPGVLTSQINVTDNFAIQGDSVAGLVVSLNITYYYDPDLKVTLTSPSGTTITLFANIGKGSNTANFTNTVLTDVTNPLAPISAAGAPYFGTFNPEGSLATFALDNNGGPEMSGGLWTLTIINSGQNPGNSTSILPVLKGWSLAFQKPQPSTGLGEAVADQKTVGFRIFNLAPTDTLANDTWTAVGPTGVTAGTNPNNVTLGAANGANLGGPVTVVALDPSDPSGNTAYIGAESGGVWKTTNFLTTDAAGPTYLPLTDFGTNYSVNIGSIAIFAKNNDPNQSTVFAGTGNGQSNYGAGGNSAVGVGILRSTNGGATFNLLDSSSNVYPSVYPTTYPNGTPVPTNLAGTALPASLIGTSLPENSPFRDHVFVNSTTYKVVVDPKVSPTGGVIVYAALGGANGGLWRSNDGGNTWQKLSAAIAGNAAATDILLDPVSVSASTGNLDILYAAFQGVGVFISGNRGQSFNELLGTVGADNLIQNSQLIPGKPLTVADTKSPNGAFGRIVLAKPALTASAAQNILYQDWLYVAVENTNGTFQGLYVTKDRGENWTKASIANMPTPTTVNAVTQALSTNDNTVTNNYDVTNAVGGNGSGGGGATHNGNSAFSLSVDPSNAEIVYLGGTQDYQQSGLIRVDLSGLYDAHSFVPFASDRNDGGSLALDSTGRVSVNNINFHVPFYEGNIDGTDTGILYTNLRHSPTDPFNVNSTLFVFNASGFINDGTGVKWTPIDSLYDQPLDGSTNIHQILSIVDPLTGLTRLIISDDQGVFTGVYNANGTLNASGIGTAVTVIGSRNGNLQDEQIYFSAAQPSTLAAQTAGALFYGSGLGLTDLQSDPNLLSNGNLTWTEKGVSYGDVENTINTNDRAGTGIATDPTGGTTITNPIGTGPSLYEYEFPFLGGDTTNFFRVNNNGQTTGLVNQFATEFPANNALYNGVIPLGNFTVNPINGSQILISTTLGNVYQTTNKGVAWLQIGSGASDFDGTYAPALSYGAPDPTAPNGLGNLNNFIYVGTVGGHVYVTQTGGGPWTSLSAGLDGSSIVAIYTNPNRGTHEAYAVTLNGVYFMANSIASAANPTPTWVDITGNLTQIQHNPFGDATLAENSLLGFNGTQLGGFRAIVADYRYAIPDGTGAKDSFGNVLVHPVLYVSGYGGVFRSLDNGQTWTPFPNTAFDSAPVDGGYLPNVDVTSLQLNLGAINPATGHPTQVLGDPEVLLASTLGRGDFAIRLAPNVFPSTIHLDTTLPTPAGSDTGTSSSDRITNVLTPFIDGISEISNFGNLVTITLFDQANGKVLGTGSTDAFGRFSIQLVNNGSDPSFFLDSTAPNDKVVGIQAKDSAGATGNITTFAYTLKHTPPSQPLAPVLESSSDSGRSNSDNITNIIAPVFDISTTEPNTTTIQLFRFNPNDGLYDILIGSAPGGVSPVRITDNNLAALALNNPLQTLLMYRAVQTDIAGNVSTPSAILTIAVKTTLPPTLAAPTLEPGSNSGLVKSQLITNVQNPFFDATNLESGDQLVLYRSFGGSKPAQVGIAAVGATRVQDATPPAQTPDGTYVYYVAQIDIAGNVSLLSPGTVVMINTKIPAQPTLSLLNADDSGLPSHPNVTNVRTPRFLGTGTAGLGITILSVTGTNYAQGVAIASTTVASDGTYLAQVTSPLADATYTLVARTVNAAGNISYSSPLVVTIKATGPQVVPSLSIFGADDTGLKGDGVTASRRPRFAGITDRGDTVTLYAYINGVLSAPQATATASTINGSFQFQLPFDLTDGSTQLVAQATDVAGNKGPLSPIFNVRIISVAGDYYDLGYAQFTVFRPTSETYIVRNAGALQVDTTPGRDIPVQYDFNGDGKTDLSAYRYDVAQYYGFLSNNSIQTQQFGQGNNSLPVSGYYDSSGTFIYALFNPNTATWAVNVPRNGGVVLNFGVAGTDIPVPAAYNGGGITEIANFRGKSVFGNDADSFNVVGSDFKSNYQVSFTDPVVVAKGFVYKAGDIPASADYDGLGRDEFAIYRPTTGQFFILNTPNLFDKTTWTLRTVTLNIPGGPRVGDQPASEDYEGTGKASPTVFRPSNSTFYEIQTTNGIQQNIQFGQPGVDVAAAGPLQYRLSALFSATGTGGGGTAAAVTSPTPGGGTVHAASINGSTATAAAATTPASLSTIALATPTTVVTPSPSVTIPVATVAPVSVATSLKITPAAPAVAAVGPVALGTIGHPNPRFTVATPVGPKVETLSATTKKAKAKAAHHTSSPSKPLTVETTTSQPKKHHTPDQHHNAVEAALKHLDAIKKGRKED